MKGSRFFSLFLLLIISLLGNYEAASQINEDSLIVQEIIPIEISGAHNTDSDILALSRKEFIQLPGAFDDPSRLTIKYPGFATTNDQANFIVYDGMPTQFSNWAVNGAGIVNPNHLSNAGTVTNRPQNTSGGVNAFSGQIIGKYQYVPQTSAALPNGSIAGLSNMTLRRPYKNQLSINLGLLGAELGLDASTNKISTFVNARYSTVGILKELGVDVGNEVINYAEVAVGLNIKDYKGGEISGFFVGGKSFNNTIPTYNGKNLREAIDINYESEVLIGGLNYKRKKKNKKLNLSLNISQRYDKSRTAVNYTGPFDIKRLDELDLNENLVSLMGSYTQKKNRSSLNISGRIDGKNLRNNQRLLLGGERLDASFKFRHLNFIPQLQYVFQHNEQLRIALALATFYSVDEFLSETTLEPKFDLSYKNKNNLWVYKLSYGNSSQRQDGRIINFEDDGKSFYKQLQRTKASHLEFTIIKNKRFKTGEKGFFTSLGLFAHYLYDIPHTTTNPYEYSYLSNLDKMSFQAGIDNLSTALSYGLKWKLNQKFKDFNIGFNGSLFDMNQYVKTDIIDISFKAPHAYNWSGNFTLGKGLGKNWYLGMALNARGGMREKLIDLEASKVAEWQIDQKEDPYSHRLAPYYRADLRLNYKLIKNKLRALISLDIQNLTNQQNEAFNYYDPLTQTIEIQRQLGIIPVLSIRIN